MLLLVLGCPQDRSLEDFQILGLNGNANHLTIPLVLEAQLKQPLDDNLQLTLDTALQNEGGLSRALSIVRLRPNRTFRGLWARKKGLGGKRGLGERSDGRGETGRRARGTIGGLGESADGLTSAFRDFRDGGYGDKGIDAFRWSSQYISCSKVEAS